MKNILKKPDQNRLNLSQLKALSIDKKNPSPLEALEVQLVMVCVC